MHLEVKVALNFIVSYLYNKLPRRRADLFGEELERLLVSRFEGHWYPETPLRGSAFRCLHLGAPPDPVVELAARRSGLDTEEVRANVPPELSVWIDPYEVSYQIGEKGAVKVLYLEDPPSLGREGERPEGVNGGSKGELEVEEGKSLGFNPEAQVFVPVGGQVSPVLPSLSSSPTPLSATSCPGLFGYPAPSTPNSLTAHSSNTSTPPPPSSGLSYLPPQQQPPAPPNPRPPPQPITFTTATFAATKFGSTKMKKCGSSGSAGGSGVGVPPQPRMLSRSPTTISPPGLLKHKALSLSLHSLGGQVPSQLSPNAKEFVYPASPSALYFDTDAPALPPHASAFQPPHPHPAHPHSHPTFDPFSSPPPGPAVGIIDGSGGISYLEKPPFVEGLGGYNLQYPSQAFQPVVLAN
ncbi:protein Tob2 [Anguilla rostrata]|uniref:protein Tob2 n=1 Tax=Anguilla anguilla TaxID=7936 RepID=UPI0015AB6564|nr:protein Tob2 [Anguilla anguilla]